MKTLNLLMVICFILFLSVMPVSAVSDNFNDQEIISDWVVESGTWSVLNTSSIEGSDDYYVSNYYLTDYAGTETVWNEIYRSVSGTDAYYEVDIKLDSVTASPSSGLKGEAIFKFEANSTNYNSIGIKYASTGGANKYTIGASGFSYTPFTVSGDTWYHIEVTQVGTSLKVDVFDVAGVLLNSQTSAYSRINNIDRLKLVNYLYDATSTQTSGRASFDNLYTSGVAPSTVNGIEWDSDQYIEGETASYSWNLQNSFWQDMIYKYRIQILKDGSEIDTVRVSQTGTRYQDVDTAGTYEVKLQYSGLIFTNWQSIDSDSVNVIPEVDSYINVPSTSAIKTNFTATYLYGSTPISPIINIKELRNDYTYKVIDTKILPAATAGTIYTTNLSISTIGYYVIDLYDNGKGKSHATDTMQTNYVYVPPFDAVLSSYIDTSMTNYSFGGVISGSYAIEDINYTDYHTRVEIYNIDKDIISFAYEPLHQIDTFDIPVTDFLLYDDGENAYVVNTNFLSGNNRVQLSAYNTDGSLNEVIAHKNITISATDEEGYGLSLSKYMVVENEIFAIKAITPVQASIIISPLTLMGVSDTTILINGSTQLSHALGMEDTYRISLVSSGETKSSVIITVLEGEEIIPPTEDEIEDEVTQSTIDMVIMFLSMPAFWGMIIWVGVVGGAAQSNAVNRSSTGYIAFALGNILAIVGMFAPYTMYILVILWIGAGVFFKLGREAAGSEEY